MLAAENHQHDARPPAPGEPQAPHQEGIAAPSENLLAIVPRARPGISVLAFAAHLGMPGAVQQMLLRPAQDVNALSQGCSSSGSIPRCGPGTALHAAVHAATWRISGPVRRIRTLYLSLKSVLLCSHSQHGGSRGGINGRGGQAAMQQARSTPELHAASTQRQIRQEADDTDLAEAMRSTGDGTHPSLPRPATTLEARRLPGLAVAGSVQHGHAAQGHLSESRTAADFQQCPDTLTHLWLDDTANNLDSSSSSSSSSRGGSSSSCSSSSAGSSSGHSRGGPASLLPACGALSCTSASKPGADPTPSTPTCHGLVPPSPSASATPATSIAVTAAAASDLAAAAAPLQAAYTEPAATATAATLAARPAAAAAAAIPAAAGAAAGAAGATEAGSLPPDLPPSQHPWDGGEGGEGAAVLSHLACVRLLLQGGADPWLEDRQGATALEVAAGLGLGQGNALLAHHKRKQGLAVARLLDQHALFHACLRFKVHPSDWCCLYAVVAPRRVSLPWGAPPRERSAELWVYGSQRKLLPLFVCQLDGCRVAVSPSGVLTLHLLSQPQRAKCGMPAFAPAFMRLVKASCLAASSGAPPLVQRASHPVVWGGGAVQGAPQPAASLATRGAEGHPAAPPAAADDAALLTIPPLRSGRAAAAAPAAQQAVVSLAGLSAESGVRPEAPGAGLHRAGVGAGVSRAGAGRGAGGAAGGAGSGSGSGSRSMPTKLGLGRGSLCWELQVRPAEAGAAALRELAAFAAVLQQCSTSTTSGAVRARSGSAPLAGRAAGNLPEEAAGDVSRGGVGGEGGVEPAWTLGSTARATSLPYPPSTTPACPLLTPQMSLPPPSALLHGQAAWAECMAASASRGPGARAAARADGVRSMASRPEGAAPASECLGAQACLQQQQSEVQGQQEGLGVGGREAMEAVEGLGVGQQGQGVKGSSLSEQPQPPQHQQPSQQEQQQQHQEQQVVTPLAGSLTADLTDPPRASPPLPSLPSLPTPGTSCCCICMDAPPTIGFRHGRTVHCCTCYACSQTLLGPRPEPMRRQQQQQQQQQQQAGGVWRAEAAAKGLQCPMCREEVEEVLLVWSS